MQMPFFSVLFLLLILANFGLHKLYTDFPGFQYYSTSYHIRPDIILVSTDSIVLLELSMATNTQHQLLAVKKIVMAHNCWTFNMLDFQLIF